MASANRGYLMGTKLRSTAPYVLFALALFVIQRPACAKDDAAAKAAADGPFEADIRAFEAADREKAPPGDAVLFVGSSSIRLWKTLETDFTGVTTIRRGFGGSPIRDCTRYADRIVIPYHPRRVILYAGDNDIAGGRTPEEVFADYKEFVAKVRSGLPHVQIDYISIKPSIARWPLREKMKLANRLIEECARN